WNVQLHADLHQVIAASSLENLLSGRLLRTWERYVAVDRRRATCAHDSSMFLGVLRMNHPTLPLDPRTLMRTPRDCPKKYIGSSVYVHFGLKKALLRHLSLPGNGDCTSAHLQLHIGGVSPFNASKTKLWPISGRTVSQLTSEPFINCRSNPYFGRALSPGASTLPGGVKLAPGNCQDRSALARHGGNSKNQANEWADSIAAFRRLLEDVTKLSIS
ncbi:uncharacterized protein DEA37_0001345, partial [Paragonimus westermani]